MDAEEIESILKQRNYEAERLADELLNDYFLLPFEIQELLDNYFRGEDDER